MGTIKKGRCRYRCILVSNYSYLIVQARYLYNKCNRSQKSFGVSNIIDNWALRNLIPDGMQ